MSRRVSSPWPSYTEEEAEAVRAVLLSNAVNQWTGSSVEEFERAFAALIDVPHAIAVSNGTLALEIALEAVGVGPGDEVIVTPRSFMASGSAVVRCGGIPVFADVDPDSQLITPASIAPLLSPRTRAIVCVHLAGWPCDMDGIRELTRKRPIALIEDCAQAHGALYKGRPVGGLGDVAAWSFCQDKIITTGGEGGMLTTSDEALFRQMWSLKDHGKDYAAVHEREHPPGFRWLHERFGTNARMTAMQAVIGIIQIGRLPEWHKARSRNASRLLNAARSCAVLRVPTPGNEIEHAWYKAYAFVRPDRLAKGWSRDRIMDEISAAGVPCFSGSCSEMYLEKAFVDLGLGPESPLPVARELGETSLMFLVHPTLTSDELDYSCEVLTRVCGQAAR